MEASHWSRAQNQPCWLVSIFNNSYHSNNSEIFAVIFTALDSKYIFYTYYSIQILYFLQSSYVFFYFHFLYFSIWYKNICLEIFFFSFFIKIKNFFQFCIKNIFFEIFFFSFFIKIKNFF